MRQAELFQRLCDHVMSERQAKVYLALLRNGRATSAELQKASGVPQTKIYEIIRQLVSQGFCNVRKMGHRRTFEALDPQTALVPKIQHLESRVEDVTQLKEDLASLYKVSKSITEPIEYIEMLNGSENIHNRYCQLVSESRMEILGFGRGPYAWSSPEALLQQERELESVLKRGGTSRWVFELRLPDHQLIYEYMERLQKKGVFYRVAESLPLKMMIFDQQALLLADEGPAALREGLSMSIIKHSTIVNAFIAYFEYIWDMSMDFNKWKKQHKLT